jgi:carboxyl-terminal processing protease
MLLIVAFALVATTPTERLSAQQPTSPGRSAYEELQTFSGVLNHIRVNYVDSVTYAQLVRAAIDGVLHSLDPHSRFESYADHDKAGKLERGELAVTGLVLEDVEGATSVLAALDSFPRLQQLLSAPK